MESSDMECEELDDCEVEPKENEIELWDILYELCDS